MIVDELVRSFINDGRLRRNKEITTARQELDELLKRYTSLHDLPLLKQEYDLALDQLLKACLGHGFSKGFTCGLGYAVQMDENGKGDKKVIAEAKIEQELKQKMDKLGGAAYKFTSPGNSGVPDRIVLFPDKPAVFVELKTAKGKLSRLQEAQIRRLRKLGQEVHVVYGMQGLIKFFVKQGYPGVAAKLMDRYGEVD